MDSSVCSLNLSFNSTMHCEILFAKEVQENCTEGQTLGRWGDEGDVHEMWEGREMKEMWVHCVKVGR